MSTRAPSWAVETVAWAAALVLVCGVAVAGSGVIQKQVRQEQQQEALAGDTPVVTGGVPAQPAARTSRAVITRHANVALPAEVGLGPPPGAQADIAPKLVADPQHRFAVIVGITNYRHPTHKTLAGARDAAFIRDYLLANGWLSQNVHVLTDAQATGAHMRAQIAWLAAKSVPGTFTLFHYSGHVKQAGGHEKLWPVDRKFINDTELASVLRRGRGKLWVDIAGCEAAGFMENLPSSRVLVSTSSKQHQKSYEHPLWRESVWVGLMWDAGLAQGQADLNGDHVTTVGEALRFAAYWAQAVTLHQKPHGRQSPQFAGDPVRGWTLANPPA